MWSSSNTIMRIPEDFVSQRLTLIRKKINLLIIHRLMRFKSYTFLFCHAIRILSNTFFIIRYVFRTIYVVNMRSENIFCLLTVSFFSVWEFTISDDLHSNGYNSDNKVNRFFCFHFVSFISILWMVMNGEDFVVLFLSAAQFLNRYQQYLVKMLSKKPDPLWVFFFSQFFAISAFMVWNA